MCFAIIPKKGKEEVEKVLAEVADLLEEFLDIVSDNVPDGLPPVWKINRQMDSILGANFPNKAAHRITPAKSEELNRQVNELLQRGLIQESLSPCVVPEILAQKRMENGGCA